MQTNEFTIDNRAALIVHPEDAAPGRPWIWRTEFFGHEPQVDDALIAKGFHLAYIDVSNMYGAPAALDQMDAFYDYLVAEYDLNPKVFLEGFSRGGIYAFNWAARHPERVAGIYADAPVCDFKSWPAGLGRGTGSPTDWEQCKAVYGLSEEEALAYPFNPIDNLAPLAAAGIPLLHVCGDADSVVPIEENSLIIQERYNKLGGDFTLINKPGVEHHPHSLEDPAPIVEWVLKHSK